jgi:hypothetical protein
LPAMQLQVLDDPTMISAEQEVCFGNST